MTFLFRIIGDMKITNEQWTLVEPIITKKRWGNWGRPRVNDRKILDGILWVLKTGVQWGELPEYYPPYQTCHRRFQEWVQRGIFDTIIEMLAMDMEYRGRIRLRDCFLDGSFASAKKGVWGLDLRNVGKAPRSWPFQMKSLFQSPSLWPLLLHMKSPWLREHLPNDLPARIQIASSLTERMIPIRLIKSS